jgi:acetylornithine deacetylase/succinyl-diaminopimelate desuccinylase-like protein
VNQDRLRLARRQLEESLQQSRESLLGLCQALARNDSQNPPGDTRAMVATCRAMLDGVAGIAVEEQVSQSPKVNLIARMACRKGGRRLVMNGHLDTGPVPEPAQWTVPPFGGVIKDNRVYGRGIADMKAGIAADVLAMRALSAFRDDLQGELVLMLVADEGTGGTHGTQYVLTRRPELSGDAMLSGDVGSPYVLLIGEKGFVWVEIEAQGKPAPGAQPHLGENAIVRLMDALRAVHNMAKHPVSVPESMTGRTIVSQTDETAALTAITVNLGMIEGGIRINNVPSRSTAKVDIRMPPGSSVDHMRTLLHQAIDGLPGIRWREIDCAEPNWTSPEESIAVLATRNAEAVLGQKIGMSIRPGFSDGRFFRAKNVPTVVYGITPHNGNAPDEHVIIDELEAVFKVHALTAFDYLASG